VAVFEERLTDALGDTAMGLSVEDHWIDGSADIIDRDETDDLYGTGFDVYLDLADLRAEGKAGDPQSLIGDADEWPPQFLRQVRVLGGRGGNIEEADLTVGARDQIAARCEVEVGFRGFEQNTCDLAALIR
jgi:hypothetical protein